MSDFSLPALAVSYDRRWVPVPLSGDLREWAQNAAADYVAAHGGATPRIEELLEGAGEIAGRAGDAVLALALFPVADEGIRALVTFCPVDMSALGESADGWPALIGDLTPSSPWEEDAIISEMTTKAGPCRRITFRPVEGVGDVRIVAEHVAYAWLLPQYAAGIVMVTSFRNLAEAGRWRSALDELAATVEVVEQVP